MARDKAVTGDGKGNKAAAQNASEGAGNNKKGTSAPRATARSVFGRFLTDNTRNRRH